MSPLSTTRRILAVAIATLVPMAIEAFLIFIVSGATHDAAGNFEPGHVSKWMNMWLGIFAPATLALTLIGWLIFYALVRWTAVKSSPTMILLAGVLGVVAGMAAAVLLTLGAPPGEDFPLGRVAFLTFAGATVATLTVATYCLLAGTPWRSRTA